jgi:prolyl oligopeptidase
MRNTTSNLIRGLLTSAVCALCVPGLTGCDRTPTGADAPSAAATSASAKLIYPQSKRDAQVDDYFGEKVPDPYRWLEAADSAETQAWVEAQNKVSFGYLEQIPQRAALKERLTQLWNYELLRPPLKAMRARSAAGMRR